jgi:GDP-L-fucose synthase
MVRTVVYPDAQVVFDTTKPDGTMRKQLDVTRLHQLGWMHQTPLQQGVETTYQWFLEHHAEARGAGVTSVASAT